MTNGLKLMIVQRGSPAINMIPLSIRCSDLSRGNIEITGSPETLYNKRKREIF